MGWHGMAFRNYLIENEEALTPGIGQNCILNIDWRETKVDLHPIWQQEPVLLSFNALPPFQTSCGTVPLPLSLPLCDSSPLVRDIFALSSLCSIRHSVRDVQLLNVHRMQSIYHFSCQSIFHGGASF